MSPVSTIFHNEATVSIGLKNLLRVGTSIHSIILDVHAVKQSALKTTNQTFLTLSFTFSLPTETTFRLSGSRSIPHFEDTYPIRNGGQHFRHARGRCLKPFRYIYCL